MIVTRDRLIAELVAAGATRDAAERRADATLGRAGAERPAAARSGARGHCTPPPPAIGPETGGEARPPLRRVVIGDPPIARRLGDFLELSLPVAPRTKKNSRRTLVLPSVAFARFAFAVRECLRPHLAALGLPLPDRAYNCAAVFHVDNDRADTVGLMQGLADALEADPRAQWPGVLSNDRWIRTWDGTAQTLDPLRPRIELRLSPIPAG